MKPERKRLLGRPRYSWEGNIEMAVKKLDGKAWNGFAGDSDSREYGNDFSASIQSWESLEELSNC